MILEIATLTVDPIRAAEFERAVGEAQPHFLAAKGCHGMRLERVIETPGLYRLVVQWETVAHHMDMFRNSENFQKWRALSGPFFTAPPEVVHTEDVVFG